MVKHDESKRIFCKILKVKILQRDATNLNSRFCAFDDEKPSPDNNLLY